MTYIDEEEVTETEDEEVEETEEDGSLPSENL